MKKELKIIYSAVQAAEDKQGIDIKVLDVGGISNVADYFLFVGGNSHIHVKTLEDTIRTELTKTDAEIVRADGQRGHLWRVLDYGSFIIHVMEQQTRESYGIERLWSEGKNVPLKPQPVKKATKKKATKKKKAVQKKATKKKSVKKKTKSKRK